MREDFESYRAELDRVRLTEESRKALAESLSRRRMEAKPEIRTRRLEAGAGRIAAVAAVVCLLVSGAVAGALGMPGVLADWLGQRSGTEVSEEQKDVIGRLTQYVGASETKGDVTVTVDSVTVGDNTIWALLVVEGLERPLEKEESAYQRYHGGLDIWKFDPNPDTEHNTIGVSAFGVVSSRILEDGRMLLFYKYSKTFVGEDTFLTGCRVAVSLDGIYYGGQTLADGPWEFQFDLEPVEGVSVLELNDVQFPAWDNREDSRGYTLVDMESVRVSATGMRCLWAEGADGMDVHMSDVSLILRDGTEIEGESVGGRYVGEMFTGQWTESVDWPAPVDLTQAEALRVGEVVIALQ